MAWWGRVATAGSGHRLAVGPVPGGRCRGGLTLLTEQPLPMAVRDGGVAQVTVRAVPFALSSSTLDEPTAAALGAYLTAVATDCFLFALYVEKFNSLTRSNT